MNVYKSIGNKRDTQMSTMYIIHKSIMYENHIKIYVQVKDLDYSTRYNYLIFYRLQISLSLRKQTSKFSRLSSYLSKSYFINIYKTIFA